jgi:hypothetical protein
LEKIRDVNDAHIKCKLERLKLEAKLFIPCDIRDTSDHYIEGKKSRKLDVGDYRTELVARSYNLHSDVGI